MQLHLTLLSCPVSEALAGGILCATVEQPIPLLQTRSGVLAVKRGLQEDELLLDDCEPEKAAPLLDDQAPLSKLRSQRLTGWCPSMVFNIRIQRVEVRIEPWEIVKL